MIFINRIMLIQKIHKTKHNINSVRKEILGIFKHCLLNLLPLFTLMSKSTCN